jgi:hypothetical protein
VGSGWRRPRCCAPEVVQFVEEDEDGMASSGPKHWHLFTVIARA